MPNFSEEISLWQCARAALWWSKQYRKEFLYMSKFLLLSQRWSHLHQGRCQWISLREPWAAPYGHAEPCK